MIEFLGAGITDARGAWLFRRLCARIESPSLVGIVSAEPAVRSAVLDVVTGARVASEGRVWIDCVPVMAGTRGRVRSRVADLRVDGLPDRVQRIPPDDGEPVSASLWRRAIAAALARGQRHIVVRDPHPFAEPDSLRTLGVHLREVVRASHVSIFITGPEIALRDVADQVLFPARPRAGGRSWPRGG